MKKGILIAVFLFMGLYLSGQQANDTAAIGKLMIINKPSSHSFKYIHFPRKNIIIKRGGIPNFKNVVGQRVVITRVERKENGSTQVVLKRADGRKFFRFLPSVKADLEQALSYGELAPYESES
jgi:hypothetical protein